MSTDLDASSISGRALPLCEASSNNSALQFGNREEVSARFSELKVDDLTNQMGSLTIKPVTSLRNVKNLQPLFYLSKETISARQII